MLNSWEIVQTCQDCDSAHNEQRSPESRTASGEVEHQGVSHHRRTDHQQRNGQALVARFAFSHK